MPSSRMMLVWTLSASIKGVNCMREKKDRALLGTGGRFEDGDGHATPRIWLLLSLSGSAEHEERRADRSAIRKAAEDQAQRLITHWTAFKPIHGDEGKSSRMLKNPTFGGRVGRGLGYDARNSCRGGAHAGGRPPAGRDVELHLA
jgi:hypothetical protein